MKASILFLLVCYVWCMVLSAYICGATYYVATNGNDNAAGTSWATALATVTNGVVRAGNGDTVLLSNGVYKLNSRVIITNKTLRLVGFGGNPRNVIMDFQGTDYGNAGCVTIGIKNTGTVEYVTIANSQSYGIELRTTGTVRRCIITGHTKYAVYSYSIAGVVESCIISNNSQAVIVRGDPFRTGTRIINSLIVCNSNPRLGYMTDLQGALFLNCIITANYSGYASGIFKNNGRTDLVNTILFGNKGGREIIWEYGSGSWINATNCIIGSATNEINYGRNIMVVDPLLDEERGYRPILLSPAINGGVNAAGVTNDIEGKPRGVTTLDIGCYEHQVGALDCAFYAINRDSFPGEWVKFIGGVAGTNTGNVTYYWDFENDGDWDASGLGLNVVSNKYNAAGRYSVKLRCINGINETAEYVRNNYVRISPATIYVVTGGNVPEYPYDSWGKAANDIQTAVDTAVNGSVVCVSNGMYYPVDRIVAVSYTHLTLPTIYSV